MKNNPDFKYGRHCSVRIGTEVVCVCGVGYVLVGEYRLPYSITVHVGQRSGCDSTDRWREFVKTR